MKMEQDDSFEPIKITLQTPREARAFREFIDFHAGNMIAAQDVKDLLIDLSNDLGNMNIPN